MSTKNNTISSDGVQKKSCLAVVEADDLFDGRRRVRLPLRSSFLSSNENHIEQTNNIEDGSDTLDNLRQEKELLGLKQSLANALELPSTTNASGMEIELYDSTNQSFQRLTRIDEIPAICCRLRIAMAALETMPPQPTDSNDSSNNNNICSHRSQKLLALPWREFSSSIDIDGKLVLKGGKHSITIHEVSNSGLGTGTNIWDGAIALAKFLEFHDRNEENENIRDKKDAPDDYNNTATMINETNVNAQDDTVPNPTYSVRGKRILELGAGTGLVGIAAHVAFGAREVVLTDLEYSLDNLRENLMANACRIAKGPGAANAITTPSTQTGTIDAVVLDWFDHETCDKVLQKQRSHQDPTIRTTNGQGSCPTAPIIWSPDVVLAADVVWVESLVRPLVQTLHYICTKALLSPPLILLSYQKRSQAVENLLFRTLEEFSFRTEDVTTPFVSTTSGAESKIRIYRITHCNGSAK